MGDTTSQRCEVALGTPTGPRDALYAGEVADGGARICVWASRERYGITVAHNIQRSGHILDGDGYYGDEVGVRGGTTLSIGGGLSVEQAEALIIELTLAIRAKRLADGEPWDGREVAPGVIRAPETGEGGPVAALARAPEIKTEEVTVG
jgi:hypothetical protein